MLETVNVRLSVYWRLTLVDAGMWFFLFVSSVAVIAKISGIVILFLLSAAYVKRLGDAGDLAGEQELIIRYLQYKA